MAPWGWTFNGCFPGAAIDALPAPAHAGRNAPGWGRTRGTVDMTKTDKIKTDTRLDLDLSVDVVTWLKSSAKKHKTTVDGFVDMVLRDHYRKLDEPPTTA